MSRPFSPSSRRAAAIVFVAAAGLFAALAAVVAFNPSWLHALDTSVSEQVAESHSGVLNKVMFGFTLLGNRLVIATLLAITAVWALRTGKCRTPVQVMIAAFLVNPVLEALLKGLVGRSRPDIARLVSGDGPAFPSGHVLATVGFYGILALIVWRSSTKRSAAVGALAASAIVIALVGFSRIYLGVHWMTDVIGGYLVGSAFVLGATYFMRGHHFGDATACRTDDECAGRRPQPVRVPSSRAL